MLTSNMLLIVLCLGYVSRPSLQHMVLIRGLCVLLSGKWFQTISKHMRWIYSCHTFFFGLSEIYVQTISKSIHEEIYWHGTMSMFCFSQKCFRTMLQHIMFPPKKINHSIQTDVGHMTCQTQRVHCNKQCENM